MILNVKKISPEAVIPEVKIGNAGLDMTAISREYVDGGEDKASYIEYDTGLVVEIPSGYVGLLTPRSSASNVDITQSNSVGIIDPNYRGSIKFRYRIGEMYDEFNGFEGNKAQFDFYTHNGTHTFNTVVHGVGDRIGQLVIVPTLSIESIKEVAELSETDRGDKGFGSSGK